LKAAAVLAGSLIAAGAATPAFAHSAAEPLPVTEDRVIPLRNVTVLDTPLQEPTDVFNTESKNSLFNTVKDTAVALRGDESGRQTLTRQG
ncbi:hypothetical protein, partial [Streptomyces griseomycini]